jgi:iron complex transport system substrate-binding protein
MRICSFLPSATEILFALGAGDEVCGVTFECDWPPEAAAKPHVVFSHLPPGLAPAEIDAIVSAEGAKGRSLYFVDLPRLEALRPDLILLQDLCRVCAIDSPTLARDMSRLESQPRVISLSAHSLEGVFGDIEQVGGAIGRSAEALRLTASLRARVEQVRATPKPAPPPRVLCLEWLDPPFQGGHWIPEMVEIAGGRAVLASPGEKSRRFVWEQAITADPEIVVVMPCGFHLAEAIVQYRQLLADGDAFPPAWKDVSAVRNGRVFAVDGTAYFSRPGPRLVDGLELLETIVSGEGFERLPAASVARLD